MEDVVERPTIALVRAVCSGLHAGGVRYCHFKSNAFLDRSRTGENDLDLLVSEADSDRFTAIIGDLGFKLAVKPNAPPDIFDYYGYDEDVGRVVHVHAHYKLIVGDDLTKNYRIPLEQAFLETARRDGEFLVPAVELEYILLVIRLVLKHCTWDAFLTRRARIPASAGDELDFLERRIDAVQVDGSLEGWLPSLDRRTLASCRAALEPGAAISARVRAGAALTAALKPFARRPRAADVGLKSWRKTVAVGRRLLSRPAPRKRLAGGAVIAIVGADGAGKSTAVEALGERLGTSFAVTRAHLGKPPPSLTTRALRILVRTRSAALKASGPIRRRPPPSRSTERAILATALARDRFRAVDRIRKVARSGGVVICDRFPLPQLSLMDGRRVERLIDPARRPRLAARLVALERRYYDAIAMPDVLIVLRVDPEIAVARRPEDPPDFVRARWQEIWSVDWEAVPAHVIDAGQPREEVLSQLETLVWSEL